jgi:hypothetical protein
MEQRQSFVEDEACGVDRLGETVSVPIAAGNETVFEHYAKTLVA